ncbi:hypothetical protein V5O48_014620 [Marasmius crinis-equi]|uniref:F-box domain-containing protein n=1 Tax=Marasmius crinis-equi TaxID=585013 RepID=A0ABR3EWT4_9AGAR
MEVEEPGLFFGFSKPYLRLYEEEEYKSVLYQRLPDDKKGKVHDRPAEVTTDADDTQPVHEDLDYYRLWHSLRFFHALEGFYKASLGKLDLSGRHLHRFNELTSIFEQLAEDLTAVGKTTRKEDYQDVGWDGTVETCVRYVMTDKEPWRTFRLKWKIPRVLDYGWFKDQIEKHTQMSKKVQGKPKLQKLCIMDLPPELINHIFTLATLAQARLLASTCRAMKTIGVPHLYHTRTMSLSAADRELAVKTIVEDGEGDDDLSIKDLFSEQSKELIHQVDFLLARPDLIEAIQNLTFSDDWMAETTIIPAFRPLRRESTFYAPINSSLYKLLASCQSLTNLSIGYFALTSDWLRAISQLTKLHTLRLHCARIDDDSIECGILRRRIPPSPHILNLFWYDSLGEADDIPSRESGGQGVWFTLLLFPNLVTFNHKTYQSMGWIPEAAVRGRSNHFFYRLRRVNLNLVVGLVPVLTAWLNTCRLRTATSCTLTHFKLRTDRLLADNTVIALLESIQSAPLEVLVFEGLKDGSLTLMERIAQLFPDLIGLTLIKRENRLQRETKLVPWPHQSGEYATRLRGFRKLRYFGWNYRISILEPTPSALLDLERVATGSQEVLPPWSPDDDWFEDPFAIALPFASHCPTLEIVGLEDRFCHQFAISRGPDGQVKASGGFEFALRKTVGDPQDWNPNRLSPGWKAVLPVGDANH